MNWPSKRQWFQIFKVLNKKERIALFIFLGLFLISSISLITVLYFKNTEVQPKVSGKYLEGMVGSPRFINPIYAQSNDVDRDLVEIIFSGLMKYGADGKIIPDLAKEVKIKEEGRIYEIYLKEGLFWHDGEGLTGDDIIFTLQTIQNPDYKSPLRGNYLGIEAEKIEENGIRFKLKNPYSGFLERLTFKIIPEHIWKGVLPQNFLLSNYNLEPVGSGPYQFKNLKQDSSGSIVSLNLIRFKNYYSDSKPYLSEINFRFFETEEDLINAAKKGKIDGLAVSSKDQFETRRLSLPRYFAVFFNPDRSEFLAEKKIRKALNYATNRAEIIEKVLSGQGKEVYSPLLSEIYGYQNPSKIYEFDSKIAEQLLSEAGFEKEEGKWIKAVREKVAEFKSDLRTESQGAEVTTLQTCLARDPEIYPEGKITGYFGSKTKAAVIRFQEKYSKEILEPWGFKKGTGLVGRTTRDKLNEVCFETKKPLSLKFSLITVQDPILAKVASQIKEQWSKIGIGLEIQTYPISELSREIIKPRDYQMLLFGEVLGQIPDPFPFWHSSQIEDPGLNLAKYENKKVDDLLEKARTTLDPEKQKEYLQEFQDILVEDLPCLFLYTPDYLYLVPKEIKGFDTKVIVDPSKRFANIENWYIKTKRVWK